MSGQLGTQRFAQSNPGSPENARTGMKTQRSCKMRERVIRETESFLIRELEKFNSSPKPPPRGAKVWCPALEPAGAASAR